MTDDYDLALDLLEAASDHMTPLDLLRVGMALNHEHVHLTVTHETGRTVVAIEPLTGPRSGPHPEPNGPNTTTP